MNRTIWVIFLLMSSCSKSARNQSPPLGPDPTPPQVPRRGPDPLLVHAWHLENTGQRSFAQSPGVAGVDARVLAANKKGYSGKGIRIAVSDTGLETSHEDLADNMLEGEHRNYHLEESPWKGHPLIVSGHGTWVTGGGWWGGRQRSRQPGGRVRGQIGRIQLPRSGRHRCAENRSGQWKL